MKKQKRVNKIIKDPPIGIKIISVYIIIAFFVTLITNYALLSAIGSLILVYLLVGLIAISISITLWKGYKNARIIVLILSGLNLINSFFILADDNIYDNLFYEI